MWEELGFYEGFALTWKAIYAKQGNDDQRAVHHTKHLLELISQFPQVNPSGAVHAGTNEELDISKLLRQIRSRYKALCASLGVRPTLRSKDTADVGDEEGLPHPARQVWKLEDDAKRPTMQGLSF